MINNSCKTTGNQTCHRSNFMVIVITMLFLAACSAPAVGQPTAANPGPAPVDTVTGAPGVLPSAAPTVAEPLKSSSDFNVDDLIPMYEVEHTSELTQADMLPDLDITTNAETAMREARFGGQLELVVKFIYKYLNLDTSINEHTFQTVYALNPYADPPVYTVFIYDRQADCLRIPMFHTNPNDPENNETIYAHSGDVTEIVNLAEANGAFIYYTCLTPPVGLGDSITTRLIATKTGIVLGAFFDDLFVGWFDFERRIWHLTEEARGWLNILDTNPGLEENLDSWLSGRTVIPESEMFDSGSRSRKFNVFDPSSQLNNGYSQYYGVFLGSKLMDEQLFIFFGFEDVNGTRYYLPFNLGLVANSDCTGQLTAVTSNIGQQHKNAGDQSSTYRCADLAQVMRIFTNKPVAIAQWVGDSVSDVPADQAAEYEARREYATAVAKFIYNSAFSSIGTNTLEGRVNAAPDSIAPADYPPSFIIQFLVQKADY